MAVIALLFCRIKLDVASAAEKPTTGTFDANGVKIRYSVQGKGEPVVLIHGWLSSGWLNWDLPGISALLARDYQVNCIIKPQFKEEMKKWLDGQKKKE
jgi:hypothetical protein